MTPKQRKAKPRTWTEWRLVRRGGCLLRAYDSQDAALQQLEDWPDGAEWKAATGWKVVKVRVTVTEQQPNRRKK